MNVSDCHISYVRVSLGGRMHIVLKRSKPIILYLSVKTVLGKVTVIWKAKISAFLSFPRGIFFGIKSCDTSLCGLSQHKLVFSARL